MDIAQFKRKSELLLGSLKIDRFIDRTQPTRTTPTTMTRSSKHSGMFMIGPSSAENGRTGPLGQITAVCLDMAPMIDTSPRWGTSPTDLRTTHSDQPDQPDHPDHHFGPSVRSGWSNCHFASILAPQVEHVAGSRMGTQSERHNGYAALIVGLHCMETCKTLNHAQTKVESPAYSERDNAAAEIKVNLNRNELSVLDE